MNSENTRTTLTPATFIDSMIRFSLMAVLTVLCFRVVSPFLELLAWGVIFAVSLYPLHQRIARRLGGRQGLAAALIVVVGCPLIGIPAFLLASSLADRIKEMQAAYETNELRVDPPQPSVADWPVIGDRVYSAWSQAAESLPVFLEENASQVDILRQRVVQATKTAIGSALMFVGAFIICGVMMAFGESGARGMLRLFSRISGPVVGSELQGLSVMTIRSVAAGVLGVAFFQALLFGVGCLMAGFPAPGVLALIVFFMGLFQLSGIFFALPAIIYMWMSGGTSVTVGILLTVFFVISGLADNVLKPLLLARGVDVVPMPVILIGALGGMVAGGFIGLFVGAILLAVVYRRYMRWVDEDGGPASDTSGLETAHGEQGAS
ncbi:MAG: AI-2E family transporter [Acidobacteriota bacterium]